MSPSQGRKQTGAETILGFIGVSAVHPAPPGRGNSSAVPWAVQEWRDPRKDHDGFPLIARAAARVLMGYAKIVRRKCCG